MMENGTKSHLLDNSIDTFGNFRIKILYFEDKAFMLFLSKYSYSLNRNHIS